MAPGPRSHRAARLRVLVGLAALTSTSTHAAPPASSPPNDGPPPSASSPSSSSSASPATTGSPASPASTPSSTTPPVDTPAPPPAPRPPRPDTVAQLPPIDVTPQSALQLERGLDGKLGPRLEPAGGGRLRHRDPRFTAIIDVDGSVEFTDPVLTDKNLSFLGFDLKERRLKEAKPHARDDLEERALYPFGPPTAPMMVGAGFAFGGLADGPRGKRHNSAKLAFLLATEPLRLRMAHAWHKQRLKDEQDRLVSRLVHAWRDPSRSLAERRRDLFLAWDECDETVGDTSPLGALRSAAAAEARRKIEGLARLLAPQGSPQQYTPAELAALNARRRSVRPFDPYKVQ